MGEVHRRMWPLLVKGSAFVAAAGLLTPIVAPIFDMRTGHVAVFVVLTLLALPFGALPYGIARPLNRTGWRDTALIGLAVGVFFGLFQLFDFSQPLGRRLMASLAVSGLGVAAALLVRVLIPPDLLGEAIVTRAPRWRDFVPAALVACTMIALPELDWASRDRSCFNVFRNSREPRSVASSATFYVDADRSIWPAVADTIAAAARTKGWLYRGKTEIRPDSLWFQHQICREPGVQILIMQAPFRKADTLTVSVTVEQPRIDWQADAQWLVMLLKKHGRVTRGRQPAGLELPAWARAIPVSLDDSPTPPSAAGSATH